MRRRKVVELPSDDLIRGLANQITLVGRQEFQVAISPYDVRQGGFSGGSVNVEIRGPEKSFAASEQNGVTTKEHGPDDASFVFVP